MEKVNIIATTTDAVTTAFITHWGQLLIVLLFAIIVIPLSLFLAMKKNSRKEGVMSVQTDSSDEKEETQSTKPKRDWGFFWTGLKIFFWVTIVSIVLFVAGVILYTATQGIFFLFTGGDSLSDSIRPVAVTEVAQVDSRFGFAQDEIRKCIGCKVHEMIAVPDTWSRAIPLKTTWTTDDYLADGKVEVKILDSIGNQLRGSGGHFFLRKEENSILCKDRLGETRSNPPIYIQVRSAEEKEVPVVVFFIPDSHHLCR